MCIDQALDFLHASNATQFESLSDLTPLELITLPAKRTAGIRQERWDVLLAYNLLGSQMVKMATSLQGYTASQLSFHRSPFCQQYLI